MRRLLCSVLLALAAGTLSSSAFADPAVERETARAAMDEGDRQFQADDFAAARASYTRARALVRAPTTGLAVAEAEERLGRFVEARDSALEVTRMPVTAGEPAVFAESRELARVLAARALVHIGVLDLTLRRAATCGPNELTVDGSRWPAEALGAPLRLDPGHHRLEARASGCITVERDVEVLAGGTAPMLLELRALGSMPDRDPAVAPPATPASASSADHRARPVPTGALALMGMGVVGLAVGVTAGAISLGKTASVRDTCGDRRCPAGEDDYATANTTGWIANGGLAGGVLAGGAGLVWFLLTRKDAGAAQISAGPRGASVSVPFL